MPCNVTFSAHALGWIVPEDARSTVVAQSPATPPLKCWWMSIEGGSVGTASLTAGTIQAVD